MSGTPTTNRRLAAIVVADVVGYSRLLSVDEAGTLAALRERRKAVVEPLTKQHSGRVVKFLGDGVLIEFASAVNAVAFALDLQRRMAEMNEPVAEARRIRLRVGINLGEVIGEDADIFGDGVNIASRIEAIAEPGGIAISGKVHEEVRGKLDLKAEDMGEQMLKNISSPVRCWRISPARSVDATAMVLPGTASDRVSIAVLPFTNMSGDVGQEYFVDGLTEDLITALAKSRFISVLSRNSTFQFKGRAVDVPTVGRQLGARYVLEGSIRKGGDRIRITAQLIDARTGAHVWAERFDRELVEVFAVQDEIVTAINAQLLGAVVDATVASKRGTPTGSMTAYDHLLRSWSAWRRGSALEILDHLEKSIEADPAYVPALGSIAFFYAEDIWMQLTGKPISELEVLANLYVEKAIAADDGDDSVQTSVGTVFLDLGDLERAKQHLEYAITLNPYAINARMNLGLTIAFMGAHREGLDLIAKAFPADPRLSPMMQAVPFLVHCMLGDANSARSYLAKIQSPYAYCHLLMAMCFSIANLESDASRQLTLFDVKRTPWYDVPGFVQNFVRGLRLAEDKARVLDGFRKLGFEV